VLADNIVHFSRVLRTAGLAVGPDRILAAIAAVEAVGLDRREDVHAALSAVMLDRHDQQPIFDQAFEAFWQDPKLLERLMYLLLPKVRGRGEPPKPRSNRLAEALSAPPPAAAPPPPEVAAPPQEHRFDAALTFSDRERLQQADFETMTADEFAWARRIAETLPPPVEPVRRRRHEPAPRGRPDLRATLQRMVRQPHTLTPAFTRPRQEWPRIVVLLDISGSMDRYSRLFLHYLHGLSRRHHRVHVLTFGTRLTNITRCLRWRDPDVALALADQQVQDWRGGTRIASALEEFNRRWARRLLGANAAALLVTDGLDRDEHGDLSQAAGQLARLAHRIVWLNPLLRYDGFEPRAAGVRALLPHVDRFLPVHNLASLADLSLALRAAGAGGRPPGAAMARSMTRPSDRPAA
jgi:uncharacterized protein with von Willebrand factor type A (vWA) domain